MLFEKADAVFQYICNNYAKFQVDCFRNVEGVSIQTCHAVLAIPGIFSEFEKAVILSKMVFILLKRQVHIFNIHVSATTV